MKRHSFLVGLVVLASLLLSTAASAQTKLLRFPDVHGDRVAFCYAGDLWTAPSTGGTAVRLTAHEGLELFPRFSPDGAWIAFTGQYDGDEQVYVVPSTGGVPKQLTWYPARGPLPPRWGYDNQVYGWTPDGERVLFRSMRESWDLSDTRLYTVSTDGGPAGALPMPVSGGGDLSPDGAHAVYSPLARDFRTWKRYQGGWAQDLYVFHLSTHAIEPVAHSERTERDPMWIGDTICFASDRTGTLNLFSWNVKSHEVEQLTHSTTWDVRWPSKGDDGEIVYEHDGELVIYDTKTKTERRLSIEVPNDGVAMRPARVSAAGEIEGFGLSPKGERALFSARGDVFSAPIEKGPTRNLTRSPGAHDREAAWSPDGRKVAYLSDATGEEEIWLADQDGGGQPERLTEGGAMRRFGLSWSPDGERIAFADKLGSVWALTVADRSLAQVARDASGFVGDYTWSPDGARIAVSLSEPSGFRSIWIWTAEDGSLRRVTDELFNESEPVWDPKGRWLFYLSDRDYAPQISGVEWNFATNRTTSIYALALAADGPAPFPPESDEVTIDEDEPDEQDEPGDTSAEEEVAEADAGGDEAAEEVEDGEEEDEGPEPVEIDFAGLASRVARVPVEADNLRGLTANEGNLFYVVSPAFNYGRDGDRPSRLMAFSMEDRESTELASDVGGYALSADGKKLLVASGGSYSLHDAAPSGKEGKSVSTSGLMVDRVPAEEWRQIFGEVWRRFRDYFYVENMHGYDWPALRAQYEGLLPWVAHRSDLNYVIGEMIAELNVSHAYVAGGDWEVPRRADVALLGARFELDPAANRYRIARILPGQNEEERYRSPLTEIGVDVREGEYLLAVEGEELTGSDDPYRLLRDRADGTVSLRVASTADGADARDVEVTPIASEQSLAYLDFVLSRRDLVDRLSQGRIGYLHVPDMGADGIREFIKWFYGQVRKEGLIVDVRGNGGGNVSQMLIERLSRKLTGTGFSRNSEYTDTYPDTVFHGPMVCLLNENSASDGDIFPWMFREAGLGPLIGKRSWGGVVGITSHGPLIDGGSVFVPEFGNADAAGQWAVEGIGVEPDIVVDNTPKDVLEGRDPQLERGVEEVLAKLGAQPNALPARPADPVKTK